MGAFKLAIIEDNEVLANEYCNDLARIKNTEVSTTVFKNSTLFINGKDSFSGYIVDLHLGEGDVEGGFDVIKNIRKTDESALIIVFSGNSNFREECIKLGADLFIVKKKYEVDIEEIKRILSKCIQNFDEVTYMEGEVLERYEEMVKVQCWEPEDADAIEYEKVLPIRYFEKFEKIEPEMPIEIIISEGPGEVNVKVNPRFSSTYIETVNISHLENTHVFKPKDQNKLE